MRDLTLVLSLFFPMIAAANSCSKLMDAAAALDLSSTGISLSRDKPNRATS